MAKVTVKLPDEFLRKITQLGDKTDEISAKMLKAGSEVVYVEVRNNLEDVIGFNTMYESKSSGELLKSLGVSPVAQDSKGNSNVKIGFSEPRSDGKSNAFIANIIEYGRHNQVAKPFLAPAKRKTRKPCIEKMKNVFEEECKKI